MVQKSKTEMKIVDLILRRVEEKLSNISLATEKRRCIKFKRMRKLPT